jgi:hypothetical protein
MRLRPQAVRRSGAAMVDAALVLPVFLTLIVGMIDLGVAVFQANVLSETARQGARRAIVHGALASSGPGSWGPGTYGPVALTDSGAVAQEISPYVNGLIDPSKVNVTVQWLDGGNQENDRVQVTLTYTYQPITTYVFNGSFPLSASSTMTISH